MQTWLTSDTHFNHANIIDYCGRPYASVGEMNYDLARRWNETVAPDDLVYHLGDFAMGDPALWAGFCSKLNGKKKLVLGNHDRDEKFMRSVGFRGGILTNDVVMIDGILCWVNHYPKWCPTDFRSKYQRPAAPGNYDIALCGHVHQQWTVRDGTVNVGVDRWGFSPISISQALEALRRGDDAEQDDDGSEQQRSGS